SGLKQTKVYQEAFEEGEEIGEQRGQQIGEGIGEEIGKERAKLEAIPRLIQYGLNLEAIAESLNLPIEVVREVAQNTEEN
ncbi:MAG: flagellar assembly protein H, partial [Oscillatoria sp. PMC 1068.18]|nr:flagellar assembly protein H [Oscillatoria sp. PMC 1076.18]MEC4991294.1 flagellar assembly protein H [Oscillatoria sp. PMC 1068.18]